MYEPVKCPDCGVWWRGTEHRCYTPIPAISTNSWGRWCCACSTLGCNHSGDHYYCQLHRGGFTISYAV